jgi:hypothetical protein
VAAFAVPAPAAAGDIGRAGKLAQWASLAFSRALAGRADWYEMCK